MVQSSNFYYSTLNRIGIRITARDLDNHVNALCPKRPGKVLTCRLGCGCSFGGNVEEQLDSEEARYVHETDDCPNRLVKCSWTFGPGKTCGAMVIAKDRDKHRESHIIETGVSTFLCPGTYIYKVPEKVPTIKCQVWGAGGGSGCFRGRRSGSGGGGAFIEVILKVNAHDVLELIVGEGGKAGIYGKTDDFSPASEWHSRCGISVGGYPGGGMGYSGNDWFASGGGGGYSSVSKRTANGPEVIIISGGGGGGGSMHGTPAVGIKGILPGTKINNLNGGQGTETRGGTPGESGSYLNSSWPASAGTYYVGGNGAEFGAGGGGGFFGGGKIVGVLSRAHIDAGGGGTAPGIAGGGGGGSSYVNHSYIVDVVSIGGKDCLPGGLTHNIPGAVGNDQNSNFHLTNTGLGDWDIVGGFVGEGGHTVQHDITYPGNNGAIRISKPGFY